MQYELWHVPPGNLVATSAREADLLAQVQEALVQEALEHQGASRAEELAPGAEDGRGESRLILAGSDLVARAVGHTRPRSAGTS
jgi:hypothetical protein